jgi:Protein of unknown function (DUF2911)
MRMPLKSLCCCCLILGVAIVPQFVLAQAALPPDATAKLPSPPRKADVSLSGAAITIDYSAPSARGRTIFGGLVPYGEVWRTGANAATTLKTSSNLQIGDLNVPAGTYTLYSVPSADGWKLVVNKQTGQWGTVYNKAQDLGRTTMSVGSTAAPLETFVIDFEKTMGEKTELHLKWAGVDASVPVTVVK